jgi:hypothetical protein
MPRKDFAAFTRLDASDVNTYLMDQSVQTFGGTAARGSAIATPVEGMVTYLEDSNDFEASDGTNYVPLVSIGAWKTWAPVLSGGFANGNGVWDAKYTQIGKTVHFKAYFVSGTTSTYGAAMRLSYPVAPEVEPASASLTVGYFARTTTRHPLVLISNGATFMTLGVMNAAGTYVVSNNMSATVPFTWATGDTIQIAGTYEAD